MDQWGRLIGPTWYLTPSHGPFNGMLPGQKGKELMGARTGAFMDGLQGPQAPQTPQLPQPPLGYGYGPPNYQMPYPAYAPMPAPMPMPQQPMRPAAYMPMQGPMGVTYVPVIRDPATGIWLVQSTVPNQGGAFRPIPS